MADNIKCKNCGETIVDNPDKHRYRDKLCSHCRFVYRKSGLHFSVNLNWLRQKLSFSQNYRKNYKLMKYDGKARKQLILELHDKGIDRLPTKEEIDKKVRQWVEEDKQAHEQRASRKMAGR